MFCWTILIFLWLQVFVLYFFELISFLNTKIKIKINEITAFPLKAPFVIETPYFVFPAKCEIPVNFFSMNRGLVTRP